jgi:hypothetical protein
MGEMSGNMLVLDEGMYENPVVSGRSSASGKQTQVIPLNNT